MPKCLDKFEPNFPLEKIVQGVLDTTTFMEPTFTCQRGTEIQCQAVRVNSSMGEIEFLS